jgi:hypothetical protein
MKMPCIKVRMKMVIGGGRGSENLDFIIFKQNLRPNQNFNDASVVIKLNGVPNAIQESLDRCVLVIACVTSYRL